ncbi:prolycopene isomerase, chloroplastic-like isoform X2 [Citrus sinensis]|uniref:prolycopene isomerase, chloroplastic-like isoform X2 n=1 Tax=Citrus sinensis TaxID=2711 RepID=UPI0022786803|nr:prolycopene isomerase, chloroplastic-like isoform X2 [Citrus sinensis]
MFKQLHFLLKEKRRERHLRFSIDTPYYKGLREDLGIHHMVVNDWDRGFDADQNFVLISVPSVLSPDLAPPGKHVLHAYTPGTEPFELWKGLDARSAEYKKLKAERSKLRGTYLINGICSIGRSSFC